MTATDALDDGRKCTLPWQVALGAAVFSTHEFLRFCFDWGHDTRFGFAHGAVLTMLWLGWALLASVPLVSKQLLGLAQIFVTGLPVYAALCTAPAGGAWGPFKALVIWGLLVPVALVYGALLRGVLARWLRRRAWYSRQHAGATGTLDYGFLLAAFPVSATLQFVAGSIPGLFFGRYWEHPAQLHEGVGEVLWTAELWAWGLSLPALFVWYLGWRRIRAQDKAAPRDPSGQRS